MNATRTESRRASRNHVTNTSHILNQVRTQFLRSPCMYTSTALLLMSSFQLYSWSSSCLPKAQCRDGQQQLQDRPFARRQNHRLPFSRDLTGYWVNAIPWCSYTALHDPTHDGSVLEFEPLVHRVHRFDNVVICPMSSPSTRLLRHLSQL